MIEFIVKTIHFLFCWSWAKAIKSLWNFGCVDTRCKNRAVRNYQRATQGFGKI